MNIRMFFLFSLSVISVSVSATWDDGISVHSSEQNGCFHGKDKRVYLECSDEIRIPEGPEAGKLKRSFQIKAFEDLHTPKGLIRKDTKLGFLNVSLHGTCIDIANIEITAAYQNQKFGQEALSTLLSVYNSTKRAHLPFEHFCLSTTTYNTAALKCYEKCGFTVGKSDKDHPTPSEWVFLFKERTLKS